MSYVCSHEVAPEGIGVLDRQPLVWGSLRLAPIIKYQLNHFLTQILLCSLCKRSKSVYCATQILDGVSADLMS